MTALRQLRLVALLEGTSFLVLLFVAMPLKYLAGLPLAVRIVGSLHGLLFLMFLAALLRAGSQRGWPSAAGCSHSWRRSCLSGPSCSIHRCGVRSRRWRGRKHVRRRRADSRTDGAPPARGHRSPITDHRSRRSSRNTDPDAVHRSPVPTQCRVSPSCRRAVVTVPFGRQPGGKCAPHP